MVKALYLHIHEDDNVGIATQDLEQGQVVALDDGEIRLLEPIPQGHKFALKAIAAGSDVVKYGSPIGTAARDIEPGQWVHTHNVSTKLAGELDYSYSPEPEAELPETKERKFLGYLRKDGSVGIRNEIWIIPTVNCTNGTAALIAKAATKELSTENIDGIYAFTHPYGCSQLGDDLKTTQKLLASLAKHPNAGGVLVLGLGCENNELDAMKAMMEPYDADRVRFLVAQDVEDEVTAARDIVLELAQSAGQLKRRELPLSHLNIGLKCGGSDGFSGITANPLVGRISDFVVQQGGSAVLTEVPEMFGAEQQLMNRAKDQETFEQIVDLINGFKEYFIKHDQPVYENPSPGNKEGGITTLEDKSLGCTEKSGHSLVRDVLDYGDQVKSQGLSLLCSPGNDFVAATALAAAGCQLILFTTGRGTPFGTAVPTVKIASNSRVYDFKQHWFDFNAGTLVEGTALEDAAEDLLDQIVHIASGQPAKNEDMDFREITMWKGGVTV